MRFTVEKKFSISLIYIFLSSLSTFCQNGLNDLNVIFKHDFENNTQGTYLVSEWNRDWLNPPWSNRQSTTEIVQNVYDVVNPTNALQIGFPANTVGSEEGGASWYTYYKKMDEIYASYDIMFMPGFKFKLGGKIPGVSGGNSDAGNKPTGYDGFTGGLMFKQDGLINFYVYYPDSKNPEYGDSFQWGSDKYPADYFAPSHIVIEYGSGDISYCRPGEWHNLTVRMVLNTVQSGVGGNYDGILEAYFDGKLVTQISHLLFRHTADLGIDAMRMISFFGGSADEWRTPINEWLRVDNVILYTFKDNMNVPRGNILSPTNRTINYWRQFNAINTEPPAAPSAPSAPTALKGTDFTDKSISLTWDDNSTNESSFAITRTLATDPSNSVVLKVKANNTYFTDTALIPSTSYVYTIKAINDGGISPLSNKDVLSTLSFAETQRVKNGLVAYYNFNYDPDYVVHDLSGFDDPVNLRILKPAAVEWKHGEKLNILSNTALVSIVPAKKIIAAIEKTNALSAECWIKPSEPDFYLSSRIISLGNSDSDLGFLMNQDFAGSGNDKSIHFTTRTQTESTNKSGYPEMIPDKSAAYIDLLHIAYVRDSLGNELLYLNGVKIAEGFRPSGFTSWLDTYYLRLANESDMNHPWLGTFYTLAIYNRALSSEEISKNFAVGPCDSLLSEDIHYQVSIYPNPLVETATIEIIPDITQDLVAKTMLRIFDIYGNIKYQEVLFNPNNRYFKFFDFKNYAKGVYFLQIISGNQQKSTKIMIQ